MGEEDSLKAISVQSEDSGCLNTFFLLPFEWMIYTKLSLVYAISSPQNNIKSSNKIENKLSNLLVGETGSASSGTTSATQSYVLYKTNVFT